MRSIGIKAPRLTEPRRGEGNPAAATSATSAQRRLNVPYFGVRRVIKTVGSPDEYHHVPMP